MPERTHDDIRRLLEHVAQDAPAFAPAPEHTVRRARRRVGTNLVTSSLLAAALFAGIAFGVRALPASDPAPPVEHPLLPVELYAVNVESGDPSLFGRLPEGSRDIALSPEADRIAYVLDVDGNPQIFVMDAGGGEPSQLTHEPLAALAPAWSPDGTQIAYRALTGSTYQVAVVDIGSGTPTRLTSEERDVTHSLAWSAGGDSILYQTSRPGDDGATQVIRRLNVATGESTPVATDAGLPSSSPDGTQIVFNTWSIARVSVAHLDGEERRIIPPPNDKSTGFARWSPDSGRLAFIEKGDLNDVEVGIAVTYVYDLASETYTFETRGDIVDWIDDQTILVVVA